MKRRGTQIQSTLAHTHDDSCNDDDDNDDGGGGNDDKSIDKISHLWCQLCVQIT
jgi:hypothetical protein